MSSLIGKAQEDDDAFWSHGIWSEAGGGFADGRSRKRRRDEEAESSSGEEEEGSGGEGVGVGGGGEDEDEDEDEDEEDSASDGEGSYRMSDEDSAAAADQFDSDFDESESDEGGGRGGRRGRGGEGAARRGTAGCGNQTEEESTPGRDRDGPPIEQQRGEGAHEEEGRQGHQARSAGRGVERGVGLELAAAAAAIGRDGGCRLGEGPRAPANFGFEIGDRSGCSVIAFHTCLCHGESAAYSISTSYRPSSCGH